MTRRLFGVSILLMTLAQGAFACNTERPLAEVIATAKRMFKDNPRSVIHECFLPYFDGHSTFNGAPPAVQEEFLYLLISDTQQLAFQPPRPHYIRLLCDAGLLYLDLDKGSESVPTDHAQLVLLYWGKAMLFSNKLDDVLNIYELYAGDRRRLFNTAGVNQWEAALRCFADNSPDHPCAIPEFLCVERGVCGADNAVVDGLQHARKGGDRSGLLRRWHRFLVFLETAGAGGSTPLKGKKELVASLLARANS